MYFWNKERRHTEEKHVGKALYGTSLISEVFSVGKEPACQCRGCKRHVESLGWEDPLEKENGNPIQDSFLGDLMDRRA